EFGITCGVVWRGLGGEPGQHGDLYRWRAPDGRSILLLHLPPAGYESGSGLVEDPRLLGKEWTRLRQVLSRRAVTSHIAEPLAALAATTGRGDRRPLLRDAWRALVRSQFHDSIGGCTSDPVARRVAGRLEDVELAAREIARTSLDALVGNDPDRARDRPE